MRRYSLPLHFTAGCTSPREPRVMKSSGFTTIPSPPRPVSSSHHSIARFLTFRISHIYNQVRCGQQQSFTRIAKSLQRLHVPQVIAIRVDFSFSCQQVKRRQFQIVKRSHGPTVTA